MAPRIPCLWCNAERAIFGERLCARCRRIPQAIAVSTLQDWLDDRFVRAECRRRTTLPLELVLNQMDSTRDGGQPSRTLERLAIDLAPPIRARKQ
jgi:hypothetical protein